MDWVDLSYLAAIGSAGAFSRGLARGLPASWRLRLSARPPEDLQPGWIWLHAISVGELLLAEGILTRLRDTGYRIHVTTGTSAGVDLLAKRLSDWDGNKGLVSGSAFPVDDPQGLRPFLDQPPGAFVALETELWPNLIRVLEERNIPRVIVNGRLTKRTLERGGPWLRRAASRLSLVCARDEKSAEAFRQMGAPRIVLGGNLKADLPPPRPLHGDWSRLREAWARDPVIVAGNTLEGEEELLLRIWRTCRMAFPSLRMILAPRQPRRFQEVAELFAREKLCFRRASEPWPDDAGPWRDTDLLLLDTLGELAAAYGEGTVALVGGGWTWHGGHNPLEPVRWGLPTLIGPGYGNFEDLVQPLEECGLLTIVPSQGLEHELSAVLNRVGLRSSGPIPSLPPTLQGALEKTWSALQDFLPEPR